MKKTLIEAIIEQWEWENIEFKEKFNKEAIQTLVAFANNRWWKVLIWISDKGDILWIKIGKETIQNRLNEIKLSTEYKIIPDFELINIKDKYIVVIQINEFPLKPVWFKWKYYKRVGNSNHKMLAGEIADEYLKLKDFLD